MEQQVRMAKQMMDAQRLVFDGMLNNMLMFWDQTSLIADRFLEPAVGLPQEGKKAFRQWIDANKKGCLTFKTAVDEGFKKMEGCFKGCGM